MKKQYIVEGMPGYRYETEDVLNSMYKRGYRLHSVAPDDGRGVLLVFESMEVLVEPMKELTRRLEV